MNIKEPAITPDKAKEFISQGSPIQEIQRIHTDLIKTLEIPLPEINKEKPIHRNDIIAFEMAIMLEEHEYKRHRRSRLDHLYRMHQTYLRQNAEAISRAAREFTGEKIQRS